MLPTRKHIIERVFFCHFSYNILPHLNTLDDIPRSHTQKHIYAQFGIGSFKDFKKVLMRATLGKYNYFVVNRQGPGVADYYHNFKKIDIKEFNIF